MAGLFEKPGGERKNALRGAGERPARGLDALGDMFEIEARRTEGNEWEEPLQPAKYADRGDGVGVDLLEDFTNLEEIRSDNGRLQRSARLLFEPALEAGIDPWNGDPEAAKLTRINLTAPRERVVGTNQHQWTAPEHNAGGELGAETDRLKVEHPEIQLAVPEQLKERRRIRNLDVYRYPGMQAMGLRKQGRSDLKGDDGAKAYGDLSALPP